MTDYDCWLYRYERTAPHHVEFIPLRQLTPEAFEDAELAIAVIDRAIDGAGSWLEIAHNDLTGALSDFAQSPENFIRNEYHAWTRVLRYRIAAVSTALRMHEEVVLSTIRKRAGNESEEVLAARRIFSEIFDSSLPYAAIYQYRNAVAHGSRGLGGPFARARLLTDVDGSERTEIEFRFPLRRDAVRATGWKASVRNRIVALPEDPDLVAWSSDAIRAVAGRRADFDKLTLPELPGAVSTLWQYYDEYRIWQQPPRFHRHAAGDPMRGLSMLPNNEAVGRYCQRRVRTDQFPPK